VSKGRCHGNQFLGLKLLLTGFVRTTATRQLVMDGGFEWSADRMQTLRIPCTLGTLPWQPFFAFLYMRCTLASPGEYD